MHFYLKEIFEKRFSVVYIITQKLPLAYRVPFVCNFIGYLKSFILPVLQSRSAIVSNIVTSDCCGEPHE